jgi:hypothetical protein
VVHLIDAVESGGKKPGFQLNPDEHADREGESSDLSIPDTGPFGDSAARRRLEGG